VELPPPQAVRARTAVAAAARSIFFIAAIFLDWNGGFLNRARD
jgi:hypothetical protein